jgi:hypothetical protein
VHLRFRLPKLEVTTISLMASRVNADHSSKVSTELFLRPRIDVVKVDVVFPLSSESTMYSTERDAV